MEWRDLFDAGTLIDLTCGLWSGMVRVKPEDLGIPDTEEVREVLTLGHERLVPKEALDRLRQIANEARGEVERASIYFPLVPGARFVPKEKRAALEGVLDYHQTIFEGAKVDFTVNYTKYKEEMEPKIRKALMDATGNDEQVVERGLKRILAKYPSEGEVGSKFYFGWKSFAVTAPIDGSIPEELKGVENDVSEAIKGMMKSLREEVIEKIGHILEMLKRGAKFTAKTLRSSRDLFSKVKSLNIFGDTELVDAMNKFEKILLTIDPGAEDDNSAVSLSGLKKELEENLEAAVEKAQSKLTLGKRVFK